MTSPFIDMLNGKDTTLVIGENSHFIAVLEKQPLALGHVLLIAKQLQDNIFDLNEGELSTLMPFAKEISAAIQKVIPCTKVGIAVLGLETRHAHMHLVPLQSADDLNFTKEKLTPTRAELGIVFEKIKKAYEFP
jgi:histidine triad (HIT) family protein